MKKRAGMKQNTGRTFARPTPIPFPSHTPSEQDELCPASAETKTEPTFSAGSVIFLFRQKISRRFSRG